MGRVKRGWCRSGRGVGGDGGGGEGETGERGGEGVRKGRVARLTAGGGRGERVEVSPPEVATLAAQRKGCVWWGERGGG